MDEERKPLVIHSESLQIAWRLAELEAANLRCDELDPVHLLLGLLKLSELDVRRNLAGKVGLAPGNIEDEARMVDRLCNCFRGLGLETKLFRRGLRRVLPRGVAEEEMGRHIRRGHELRSVFAAAEASLSGAGNAILEPLHLLRCLAISGSAEVDRALDAAGITGAAIIADVDAIFKGDIPATKAERRSLDKAGNSFVSAKQRLPGPAERLGRDLTQLARDGKLPPVIGRRDEMRTLAQTLLRSRKNSVILIGEAGVGKTVIVEGLAQRIADGDVPEGIRGKRIVEISMGELVAGTNLRGDMEQRLQDLIAESARNPDLIIFIDEIHLLAGAGRGSGGAMDAANILKPALARGEVRVIGATTTREYRRHIEADPALARRFEVIEVAEPSREEAIEILHGLLPGIESHHGVKIEGGALAAAVDLTIRYLPSLRLPDKAIDILDQTCSQVRMTTLTGDFKAEVPAGRRVSDKDVAAAVAHRCKVPVGDLVADEARRLLTLETIIAERVRGQDEAIHNVSEAIRISRSGVGRGDRPVAVFLFAGPSGTGKTELARTLAAALFGGEEQLIRLDMSEFMEAHSVSKMIGSPPGFVGYEERGRLTEAVRDRPHSVVLLDEVEKAHPKILDLFLQVFDHGCLTDAHGVRCDFRDTIIIMTSNFGVDSRSRVIGFGDGIGANDGNAPPSEALRAEVGRFFRPEFLNRLTEIVVFRTLNAEILHEILGLILNKINIDLRQKGIEVHLERAACDRLIELGCCEISGVRGLEGAVRREVGVIVSKHLLSEGRANGGCLTIDFCDGAFCDLFALKHPG